MPKTIIVKTDWNDIKSIEKAEKKINRLVNKGYNLFSQSVGLFITTQVYILQK